MYLKKVSISAIIYCISAAILSVDVCAEDWIRKEFEVAGGGIFSFEFPTSWGKKPEYISADGVTQIRFGPYGPKSKPIFLLNVMAGVSTKTISDVQLLEFTKIEVEKLRSSAFETDIPISNFKVKDRRGLVCFQLTGLNVGDRNSTERRFLGGLPDHRVTKDSSDC